MINGAKMNNVGQENLESVPQAIYYNCKIGTREYFAKAPQTTKIFPVYTIMFRL